MESLYKKSKPSTNTSSRPTIGAPRKIQSNTLPHFTAQVNVDGFGFGDLDVHFPHEGREMKGAIPLLFVHGWPGSFLEVSKMLGDLKGGNAKPSFMVVAPSFPIYCFSQCVEKKGFEIKQYAETCHKLMLKLGYDQYVTQGGDLGFLMTRALAHLYPKHVRATDVNWIFASPPQWTTENPEPVYTPREEAARARAQDW